MHYGYTDEENIEGLVDEVISSIEEGLLAHMQATEMLIEDEKHDEQCDGTCSDGAIDEIFGINRRHLDRMVESFRTSLVEVLNVKERFTSDAREET